MVKRGLAAVAVAALTVLFFHTWAAQAAFEVGDNDFRISNMGPDGDLVFAAFDPAVAVNTTTGETLVVWEGDDRTDNEYEIWGQLLGPDGVPLGEDFRISDMGPDGSTSYEAQNPAVTYNPTANEYLVVWEGDDNIGFLVDGEYEIWSQRLDANGFEVGANDFRISDMGNDGTVLYQAFDPAVTYNATADEYLVVWEGEDDTLGLGEREIFAQRLDGSSGFDIASNFRISDMGPNGNAAYAAFNPAVTYNATADEYLVVWRGDDDTGSLVEGENEIFGQRLDGLGAEVGVDFRISDMGPDGSTTYLAYSPAVTYNPTANEYLVVWRSNNDTSGLAGNEIEIWGQRLDATGGAVGTNDFRISKVGPDGNGDYDTFAPAVTHNATADEYLVVWYGDNDLSSMVDDEFEIWGQRLDATGGAVGDNDFRISDVGPDGTEFSTARHPAVTYNVTANEYLVVWQANDDIGPSLIREREVNGQLLATNLASTIHPIANQNSTEGDSVSLTPTTTNPDSDTLTFTATGLPPGLSINTSTGTISGTVGQTAGGTYTVTVTVTDDGRPNESASTTFGWFVQAVNIAPTVTNPGNQNSAEGDTINLPIAASDTDDDPLTYSATGLPPGLSINTSTGVISGALSLFDADGTYTVTVTASDSALTDSVTFDWTVSDTNLLTNGDLEDASLTPWTILFSGGIDGAFCQTDETCILLLDGNGATEFARQTVSVSGAGGDGWELTFNAAGKDVASGGVIGARVEFLNGGAVVNLQNCLVGDRGSFDWTPITCPTATASGTYDAIRVTVGWQNVSSGLYGVDDIELVLVP